ncbi:MAG: hypothetical protein AB7E79_07100 [Rhodospirillaceae bacterium]
MPKATVDAANSKVTPEFLFVKKRDKDIVWQIKDKDWQFAADLNDSCIINDGGNGTLAADQFHTRGHTEEGGKRKKFRISSHNSQADVFKYTLTLVNDRGDKKTIDPSICNTGDFFVLDIKTIIAFIVGLAAGAFGARYFGF